MSLLEEGEKEDEKVKGESNGKRTRKGLSLGIRLQGRKEDVAQKLVSPPPGEAIERYFMPISSRRRRQRIREST